jgi:tetratricopeptide (TPR) repeat protein
MPPPKRRSKIIWTLFTGLAAITAFVLGVVTFRYDRVEKKAERDRAVREFYNKAWDILGGAEGAATIEEDSLKTRAPVRARALNVVNEGLALAPDDPDLLATKGLILAENGNPAGAEELYRRALDLKPRDVVAHNGLGLILQNRRQYDDAIALYNEAIKLKPDDLWIVYYNLGTAYEESKRIDDAEAAFRKAIELRGDFGEAYFRLGDVLKAKHQFAEAQMMKDKANELLPPVTATDSTAAVQPTK